MSLVSDTVNAANSSRVVRQFPGVPAPRRMPDRKQSAGPGRFQNVGRFLRISLGRFCIPAGVVTLFLLLSGSLRLAMLFRFCGPGNIGFIDTLQVLATGLRFDLLTGLCFMLPQTLLLGLLSDTAAQARWTRWLLQALWLGGLMFLVVLGAAEWLFFAEFETRLNYIAFEYLVYPTEVCCNIWQSYAIVPLLMVLLVIGGGMFAAVRGPLLRSLEVTLSAKRRGLLTGMYLMLTALLWCLTGMDDMEVADSRVANECANNGLYSFVYYAWTCRFDFDQLYLTIDEQTAVERVQNEIIRPWEQRHDDSISPLDRTVWTTRPQKNFNVVLILEESLGADFIGVLGDDRGLSPHFDKLAEQGMLFDNFYATGNRTARALEAVLTSMPPLPTESILKRDHSDHVYTLAHVLAARGYERLFMTGGRGLFDGVRSFMTANGFNRFLEQSDFDSPVFSNAWGVSDEDLFRRGVQECDRLHATGRPFFAVLLTVSNHRPYTFPEGRIAGQRQSRTSAVRYADWALGQFFEAARQRPFFRDTIFLVMGDHGARVYGAQQFPVQSYRVPVLLIHPDTGCEGRRCHTLGCSMDIAPTILGLLGGTYRSVFFGRDLLQLAPGQGMAFMQHNHDVALLDANDELTVLSAGKNICQFQLDPDDWTLTRHARHETDSLTKVIAWFQTAYRLYYDDRCFPQQRPADR